MSALITYTMSGEKKTVKIVSSTKIKAITSCSCGVFKIDSEAYIIPNFMVKYSSDYKKILYISWSYCKSLGTVKITEEEYLDLIVERTKELRNTF